MKRLLRKVSGKDKAPEEGPGAAETLPTAEPVPPAYLPPRPLVSNGSMRRPRRPRETVDLNYSDYAPFAPQPAAPAAPTPAAAVPPPKAAADAQRQRQLAQDEELARQLAMQEMAPSPPAAMMPLPPPPPPLTPLPPPPLPPVVPAVSEAQREADYQVGRPGRSPTFSALCPVCCCTGQPWRAWLWVPARSLASQTQLCSCQQDIFRPAFGHPVPATPRPSTCAGGAGRCAGRVCGAGRLRQHPAGHQALGHGPHQVRARLMAQGAALAACIAHGGGG